MLSRLKLHHSKRYQPLPRIGHDTVIVGDRVYLWGGWHKLVPKVHSSSEKIKSLSVIEVYNLRTGEWGQIPTSGVPPLGVAYHACARVNEDVYYFGGRCGHRGCHHNTLHRLSTVTMKWKDVTPSTSYEECCPMKKAECGMVRFKWRSEDLLLVLGGYGPLPVHRQPQVTYVQKKGKVEYGWTNEIHVFSIQTGQWSLPLVTGERPPPCSNFSIIAVSDHRAVMFGGYQGEGNRMNDVYIAEFGKESVFWTKVVSSAGSSNVPWPKGTCDHSMTFASGLYGPDACPCILIIGGENDDAKTLSDCWIFDLPSTKWTQVCLPAAVAGRLYHAVSSFTLGPHCVWILLFGGVAEMEDLKDWQEQRMMADTAIIELMKRDNEEWIATVIMDNTVSSSLDDYLRKLSDRVFQGRKDWIHINTKTLALLPPDEEKARAERADKRADAAEQEAVEARKLAEVSHLKVVQAKETADNERKESITLCGDLSDAKKRAQLAELQMIHFQDELQRTKEELNDYKKQLTKANKNYEDQQEGTHQELIKLRNELSLLQSSVSTSAYNDSVDEHWVLKREDILIEEEVLLRCRTGDLYNGFFHGTEVGVKVLSKVKSLDELKRIMNINSKLRHSNLLLFMGATVGDDPLIVTECISFCKPLNVHLEETPLSRSHLLSLAKDVSCALNYLHLHIVPVTHGSVSSQSVLLTTGWRGKLTDVNFFPHMVQPLATYAAPEVMDTSSCSPQIDVYSFGVLLIEMYCRKALGTSNSERSKQLQHINWPQLVVIIRLCLSVSSLDRPLIEDVLLDLKQLS